MNMQKYDLDGFLQVTICPSRNALWVNGQKNKLWPTKPEILWASRLPYISVSLWNALQLDSKLYLSISTPLLIFFCLCFFARVCFDGLSLLARSAPPSNPNGGHATAVYFSTSVRRLNSEASVEARGAWLDYSLLLGCLGWVTQEHELILGSQGQRNCHWIFMIFRIKIRSKSDFVGEGEIG